MEKTIHEYDLAMVKCKDIFIKKMKDYGCAWRILRLSSLTDQIFIKAQRIRSIEMNEGRQKVGEDIRNEFIGIVNYSIIALIQLEKGIAEQPDMDTEEVDVMYNNLAQEANDLMQAKNHDYGEAWRDMRVSSLTDLILQKLLRVKQIENNKGKTLISEGIDANYFDMINYAIFALIKLN
ncbi:MAG: hypothetical protein CMP66_03080 [Flavobacteriales bacterium]|nr:hypothetical protein [Flavobacteriales bacterium]|tara:strand:+ start:1361 stop:1897 length:537 start_codon:yes stop_codon:yes gene_type:complete